MVKFPSLKCPCCAKKYTEVPAFAAHVRGEHPGTIPEDWSDLRYAYFVYTGRSHGKCRECGGDTPWNETTGCYAKICTSPACKKKYRDRFMASMRAHHGKDNLLDDPKYRERMLTGRKISGTYVFQDGGEVAYMGRLEKAFLVMLDRFFSFPSCDIISPSPNRYIYHYTNPNDEEHEGEHTYVPDFYIPSCNLEIELKSSKNERPRNLMIDVPRDACKDLHMIKNPSINYVKVYEDDYHVFFQVFADMAMQNQTGEKRPIKYISRALLTSVYRDYIPDDILRTLDGYIYKYSDKSVLKKGRATESDLPILETPEDEPEEPETTTDFTVLDIDAYYADDAENIDESEPEITKESYGLELIPLSLNAFADDAAPDPVFEGFAIEGFFGITGKNVDTNKIDGRAAVRYSRWRDRLFGGNLVGTSAAKAYVKVAVRDGILSIKGINCNLLLYRIKETYAEGKLKYIFQYAYNAKSLKLYEKRKIGRGDMKIDYVYAPEFFCLELIDLFRELGDLYHDNSYRRISEMIYEVSWLSRADKVQMPPMSTAPLKNLALELMPHQIAFIEQWPQLKAQLNLKGYILSFKPGKGKTLTAVGLAECLHTQKVYIVCPNNLKDNWALEIKKYYSKYSDERLWEQDVCILGSRFGNPKTARFIIVNNESIKLMQAIAKPDPTAMLILDECHNFRNYNGGRTKELFALADKIQSDNVLCVSATPIKASPAEITPALYLIDPTFNDEAAAMYAKCFDLSTTSAMGLINKRFGMIIYRPADVQVDLPPKNLNPLPLKITNEERFYLSNVHDEIVADFQKRHNEWLKTCTPIVEDFRQSITKWALCDRKLTNGYLQWVIYSSNALRGEGEFHELDIKDYKVFIETNIRANSSCPNSEVERLLNIERELITAAKRHMGYAVGSILPPRRNELYIRLYEENREKFYEMIRNRGKKTVIFSTMVPVIKHIVKDLDAFGIGVVSITGETKNRLEVLNQFREDPNTLVLVATSWCMGVGVTLTEASQMFFFGTPWRSTDFEQACDRIWRIGQTETCDIWTVMCQSKQKNLSDRMQDILDWSNRMFDTAITAAEVGDDVPAENEAMLLGSESYRVINIDEIAMEGLFNPSTQMLGGVQYTVEDGHVLFVLTNYSKDNFIKHILDFNPIFQFAGKFAGSSVLGIDDLYDAFNEPENAEKHRKWFASKYPRCKILWMVNYFIDKCCSYDPKNYIGVEIFPAILKEALTAYTTKYPKEFVIVYLTKPAQYTRFMEYPVIRIAAGAIPNAIWGIEEAVAAYNTRSKTWAMTDPSLRGKGTAVKAGNLRLFHVSPFNFDKLTPTPTRTPLFGENVVIPRASAAPSVKQCFEAVGLKNFTVYHIYELNLSASTRIVKPNRAAVPDAPETGEHWVLDPVKVTEIDRKFVVADYFKKAGKQISFTNARASVPNPKDPSERLIVEIDNQEPFAASRVIFTLFFNKGERIGYAKIDFNTRELQDVTIEEQYRHRGYATVLLTYIATRANVKFTARAAVSPNDTGAQYVSQILMKIFGSTVTKPASESFIEPVMESERAWRNIGALLKTMHSILNNCKYGMLVNGKIEDPDDAYYEEHYRTVSPGIFIKQKCGTCYDFAVYQDFFLKAHNIFCQNYFIELLIEPFMTHTFTIIERSDGLFIYTETAFQMIAGDYQAYTIDEIISYVLNNMAKAIGRMKPFGQHEFKIYRLKPNYGTFGESLKEYADRVHATAKEVRFRYDPKMCYLQPFQGDTPVTESFINFNVDSHQYEELTPEQITAATKIYTLTEYPIHSIDTPSSGMTLPGVFPFYMRYLKKLRHILGVEHNIATFVVAVRLTNQKNPEDLSLHHVAITIPFNDGAIIPEFGLTLDCNGLYFAESLPNAILGIAQKMGEVHHGRDFNICTSEYKIDAWIVMQELIDQIGTMGPNVFGEWLDKVYATTNTVSLETINPNWRELHKMEVLKHGWIAKRY